MMKRMLCIWLPNWPAQQTRAARPGLDPRQALEALAGWCRQFSPLVGAEDSPEPDSLFLDITGLEHLFGSEALLGQRILDALHGRGLSARLAIADTLGAAWAAAHFPACKAACGLAPLPDNPKTLSRERLAILPPGETPTQNALRPLPIQALRLPGHVVERLHSVGIHRIGQLDALPRQDLALRFGPALVDRWDQALGRRAEPIPACPPVRRFRLRQDLEYPTARRECVESVLHRLIDRLTEMLLASGQGAVRVDCRVHGDCPDFRGEVRENGGQGDRHIFQAETARKMSQSPAYAEFSLGLFRPSASAQHLLELVRLRLERLGIPGPVTAVSIDAAVTAPIERRQEELFELDGDRSWRSSRRVVAGLIDRLASRLGPSAVLCPRLLPDAQPERAYRYDPLRSPSPPTPLPRGERGVLIEGLNRKARRRAGRLATAWDRPSRPLRLIGQPLPVSAVSLVPDGPPLRFLVRGREHRIEQVWGPERIETGWWRGPMVARDYYRVETALGRRYWLFRRLDDGRWFLHGTFE
jgi:protein ImuB